MRRRSPSPVDRAFDLLTGTFQPLLWALVGSSMIKTFLALAVELGWISTQSTTYAIWAACRECCVLLPAGAGRHHRVAEAGGQPLRGRGHRRGAAAREFTGMGPVGTESTFLGLPVVVIDYGQSVFPALIAAILLSIMEKALRRRLPRSLHLILIPTICLAVLVPATAILFGPVGTYVSEALSAAIGWLWQPEPRNRRGHHGRPVAGVRDLRRALGIRPRHRQRPGRPGPLAAERTARRGGPGPGSGDPRRDVPHPQLRDARPCPARQR